MSNPFDVLATRLDAVSRQLRAQAGGLADTSSAVEALTTQVTAVMDRLADVEDLAATIATAVGDADATDPAACRPRPLVSWLAEPEPNRFDALTVWIDTVLVQYPDVADALGECWALHPWIVEELTALRVAWLEAYTGEHPCGSRAVDWHDRHRPGVIERIRRALVDCSIDAHRPGGRADHTRLAEVPGLDHAPGAVAWWTSVRPADTGADGDRVGVAA